MTGYNESASVLRSSGRTTLSMKITGLVFWGMILVGISVTVLLLHGLERDIASRQQMRADRFAYALQQYLLHEPHPLPAELQAAARRLRRESGVAGASIRIASESIRTGDTGSGLTIVPRLIQYTARRGTQGAASAFATIYEPALSSSVAAARRHILMFMGAITLLFGMVLQWVLGRVLSQPFERMVATAHTFSRGDPTVRFDETRDDEFGFLAQFINRALDVSASQQQALREALADVQQSESELFAEKERAEVTLHSIGDAVITTDRKGTVEYMNPVAESLTGIRLSDARGTPLGEVLKLVDEETRGPIESPVDRCLREGTVVGSLEHVVMLCPDGQELDISPSAAPIHNRSGDRVGAIMVFHDVGHVRRMARQLSYQAAHDALTGLYNRREFERQLQLALEEAKHDERGHALCFLDMDQFKVVNDTCGHAAGDELLRRFSAILRGSTRDSDVIARLGGDEFGVLLRHCDLDLAMRIAEDLLRNTHNLRFTWQDHSFDVGVSIGVVPVLATASGIAETMSAADVACYAAKDAGRNRVHAYRSDDDVLRQRHAEMRWVSRLQRAMEGNRFRLFCQPVMAVSRNSDLIEYHEMLLRLEDESGGLIPPVAFVPAAERYSLMPQIDRWVVRATLSTLQSVCPGGGDWKFAINVSGQSLCDDRFVDYVIDEIRSSGIAPRCMCFEISEAAAMANPDQTMRLIGALRALGCSFALDNFGSSLNSFLQIRELKMDYLKLDGCFIKDIAHDAYARSMVEAANHVVHAAGISMIAEFAETQNVVAALRRIGVDYAQGFAIANPRPLEEVLAGSEDAPAHHTATLPEPSRLP